MGESSPSYTYDRDWREVPIRIKRVIPNAKLLYIVRDPIERILSHYQNLYRKRQESRSLEEALYPLDLDDNVYIRDTRYYTHLSHYLRFFDRSKLHVVILEELRTSPQTVLKGVFDYLDVESSYYSEEYTRPKNKSAHKRRETDLGHSLRVLRKRTILSTLPIPDSMHKVYKKLLKRPVSKPIISPRLEAALKDILGNEMDLFRTLTGKPLVHWNF